MSHSEPVSHKTNFIRNIIEADNRAGTFGGKVVTRFPPEPNGYLHIGHAKSICLNFGLAKDYNSYCYLRFDDTNPCTESEEFMNSIKRDVQWLGFDWGDKLTYASEYFQTFYDCAVHLINAGKAYVCSLTAEQVREYRGTLTEPGRLSPDRDRSIAENLDLFKRMAAGEFDEGQYSLRAKIDMASGNINMRDPALYRIRKVAHHHVGDKWCVYPMYDYAHPLEDAIEGITHSLCTLEFQDHRPLYDWVVENCGLTLDYKPKQIEFSRLNLSYTMTSKRKLKQLVEEKYVLGWDDPRMPTLAGQRRRGVPAAALRSLCEQVGISKQDSVIDVSLYDEAIRNELNQTAPRRMAVLKPIKVIIDNYPEDKVEPLELSNHPNKPEWGKRKVLFSNTLYIEQDDFMLNPPEDFYRLGPGRSVRLINAYVIECHHVEQDATGNVIELHCHYLPETLAGQKPADGRKVKGIIHWLSAPHAITAQVRLYERLFNCENPGSVEDLAPALNTDSLHVINAFVELDLLEAKPEQAFQFNRLGYFVADQHDHAKGHPVFNRTVGLKESAK